jgi:hypothetical protein
MGAHRQPEASSEDLARLLEDRLQQLMGQGVDETTLRQLAGEAVRLGRSLGPP